MAETLLQFQTAVTAGDGSPYDARACGAETADGRWEGWIEFIPLAGGRPIRSSRETTQPNRRDIEYWATGLSPIYLEGALRRALDGPVTVATARTGKPAFDGPAPPVTYAGPGRHESALNPFSVYAKGEPLLRRQLAALSPWHLVNIALAYELTAEPEESLSRQPATYLIDVIVEGVRDAVHPG